jgi:hypothetical protein
MIVFNPLQPLFRVEKVCEQKKIEGEYSRVHVGEGLERMQAATGPHSGCTTSA